MKNKNIIVGKKAVIDCLTEQLKQIGIPSDCKHIYPGKEVKIFRYDDEHSKFGSFYKVDDLSGCPADFFYSIPLIWLNFKK